MTMEAIKHQSTIEHLKSGAISALGGVTGYHYPETVGEPLEGFQPYLEFQKPDGKWVPSGMTFGNLKKRFVGKYRVRIPSDKNKD